MSRGPTEGSGVGTSSEFGEGGRPTAFPEVIRQPARRDLGRLVQRNLRRTSLQRSEIVCGGQRHADPRLPFARADFGRAVTAGDADGVGAQTVALDVTGDQRQRQ